MDDNVGDSFTDWLAECERDPRYRLAAERLAYTRVVMPPPALVAEARQIALLIGLLVGASALTMTAPHWAPALWARAAP